MELDLKFYEDAKKYRLQGMLPSSDFYFMIGTADEFSWLHYILNVLYDRGIYVTNYKDWRRMEILDVLWAVYEHWTCWRGVYINFSWWARYMPYISSLCQWTTLSASTIAYNIKNGF